MCSSHNPNQVHFHLTTGYDFWFSDFVAGRTFRVVSEEVLPATRPAEAPTHAALARYLVPTFGYAGTLSLSRELRPVPLAQVQPGDVLIHGGAPGHAVLVVDVAEHATTHQKYLLLAQSYMPAQSIHVLRNIEVPATRRLVRGTWAGRSGIRYPGVDVCPPGTETVLKEQAATRTPKTAGRFAGRAHRRVRDWAPAVLISSSWLAPKSHWGWWVVAPGDGQVERRCYYELHMALPLDLPGYRRA